MTGSEGSARSVEVADVIQRSDVDERRAWGWVEHLRDGGTTPWSAWAARADRSGRFLPGAQQLELLRRLNAATGPVGVPAVLAGRVLDASAPGRGRPDLQLLGGGPVSRWGPRPVDPAGLPADELVRVATSVIADDVVAAGPPVEPAPALTRPWRRAYRLVGDPVLADPLRAQLVARGRPPGGGNARILVLGDHADVMLADAFEARALDTGGTAWADWLAILAARDELAPRVDLAQVARTWARRTRTDRVTLVLDPGAVAGLLGVRRLTPPARLSAEAVDLARRVAAVLGLLVTPGRRSALLRGTLAPMLRARAGPAGTAGAGTVTLAVPDEHRAWLSARSERMREQLSRAGCAVAGGPARGDRLAGVLPAYRHGGVTRVADEAVLEQAIGLLLSAPVTRAGDR